MMDLPTENKKEIKDIFHISGNIGMPQMILVKSI
jgi:hypothetical protein